jgi:hypothetical protein
LERLLPYLQHQQQQDHERDEFQQDDDYRLGDYYITTDAVNYSNNPDTYGDDPDYQRARMVKVSSPFFRKHERLHKAMAEIVGEFGLISFLPLDISSAESVGRVLARIDKCNGYSFIAHDKNKTISGPPNKAEDLFQCAVRSEPSTYDAIADIQERLAMARVKDGHV